MNKLNFYLLALCVFYFTASEAAEDLDGALQPKSYVMKKVLDAPVIDGNWNDAVWQQIEPTGNFIQTDPVEHAPPTFETEVKIFYNDNAVYFAVYCYDPEPDKIMKQLGNRDDNLNADFFEIMLDPYDAQQDFTGFMVTASGVQVDYRNSDGNFNAVWESAVSIVDDGWIAEIKIPYSAIRFPSEASQQWSLQMFRHIRRLRENDAWSPTQKENSNFMDYFGKLTDIRDIDPPMRLSLTPFINVQFETAPDENGQRNFDWLVTGGADLKYGINESFTLDMTLLPDFSQVQSDDQINNLSAFETQFNEQRAFFQEGIDLFRKGSLFYSRRIGSGVRSPGAARSAADSTETIVSDPEKSRLLNAFKISGHTKKDIGIGVFNAIEGRSYAILEHPETGSRKVQNDPLSNYNIFVLEKNFKNNRSIYGINTNVSRTDGYRNGNVAGIGFSANFKDNMYNFRGSASYSVVNEKIDSVKRKTGYQYVVDFDKISGQWRYGGRTEAVSKNYDRNDLGIIFQTDYFQHGWSVNYNIYDPLKNALNLYNQFFISVRQHAPTGEVSAIWFELRTNTTLTNKYIAMWARIFSDPYGEKDFFEARTDGQVFRRPKFVNLIYGFSTDYRKKLAVDVEVWSALSGYNGGTYEVGTWIRPIYRVNDHLTLDYTFNLNRQIHDVGFADRTAGGDPVFGRREVTNYNNVFSGNYIFKNNLSLGARARHYWSRVDYNAFYELNPDGSLASTEYTDPDEERDINFNAFNIDLLFSWEFAPGSALSVSYKNSIFDFSNVIEGNIFRNLSDLFDQTQTNVVSIRLLYYLDYVTVRSWVQKHKLAKGKELKS